MNKIHKIHLAVTAILLVVVLASLGAQKKRNGELLEISKTTKVIEQENMVKSDDRKPVYIDAQSFLSLMNRFGVNFSKPERNDFTWDYFDREEKETKKVDIDGWLIQKENNESKGFTVKEIETLFKLYGFEADGPWGQIDYAGREGWRRGDVVCIYEYNSREIASNNIRCGEIFKK